MIARTIFGKTGLQVSRLGFGAASIGFLKPDMADVTRMLNALLDSGVNVIDTAAAYDISEEMIAQAIGSRRGEFVLISKCGNKVKEIDAAPWTTALVSQTVDRALRRLKTDHLDVMLLHTCNLETLQKGEALGALLAAKKAGKVRFVGYSGDNEVAAWGAARAQIDVIETSINIADQINIDLVLPVAKHNNVAVIVKRPIANAGWKPTAEQPGFFGDYAKPYHERLKKMGLKPADFGFGGPEAQAWPEMSLRFTLAFTDAHVAIIGTTKPDHAQANLAAAGKGPLPAEAVRKIREVFRRSEEADGAVWTGQG